MTSHAFGKISTTRKFAPYGWLLFTMMLWGSAFPSSRWAVGQVPHEVAALFRFGGGAIVLVLIVWILPSQQLPTRQTIIRACLTGLVGVFGYNALFFWGVTMAPASDGSVMFPALVPVITTTVLVLAKQEKAPPMRIVGLILGCVGAALFFLATSADAASGSLRMIGDVVFAAGAAIWSAYTLLSRKLLVGMDPLQGVAFGMIAGSVALGGMAIPTLGDVHWAALSSGFWINAAYLAIGPTAVAYLLYVRGIRDVGASATSSMMFAVPVFGTAFSFLFLDESFTLLQAAAAIVMLGGAYMAVVGGDALGSRRKKTAEEPLPAAHTAAQEQVDSMNSAIDLAAARSVNKA